MLRDACVMENVLVNVISDLFIEEDPVIHYNSLFDALIEIYFNFACILLIHVIYVMKKKLLSYLAEKM